jgi:hypothetical protein
LGQWRQAVEVEGPDFEGRGPGGGGGDAIKSCDRATSKAGP